MSEKDELLAINLNANVFVKLKMSGFTHWAWHDNQYLPPGRKKELHHYTQKMDKDGYVKFHMWEFMQVFGPTINHGTPPMFDTNVKFHKRDLGEKEEI